MTALAGAIMDHTWIMQVSCCYAQNHLIFSSLSAAGWGPQLFLYVVCSQSCRIERARSVSLSSSLGERLGTSLPFSFVLSTHLWQCATGAYLQHVNAAFLLWIRVIKAIKLDFAIRHNQDNRFFGFPTVPSWRFSFWNFLKPWWI